MRKDMDELLYTALTPMNEPRVELNDRILLQVKERQIMNGKKKKYQRRIPAAAIAAVCILMLCSGTALAVYKYLTPAEVAKEADDDTLQRAFLSDDAIPGNETQESGGYRLTLLGSVAGKNISDFIPSEGTRKQRRRLMTIKYILSWPSSTLTAHRCLIQAPTTTGRSRFMCLITLADSIRTDTVL